MPLGIKKVRKPNLQKRDSKKESRKAALHLIQFEKNLYSDNINKKQKRKIASDTSSSDHLKSREHLELNSIIDTINSKSDSIDSTANTKATLQDTDANILPSKKQKRKRNEEAIVSGTSDNLKNRDHLELNSVMDIIDSKSDSIDSTANIKTNLHNADTNILPLKKHKRKRNGEAIASDTSPDNLKNRDYLELNSVIDTINSKSNSNDSIANIKATSQDVDANIMSSKKQKCNLTYNKFDNKHVIEDKKKLTTKAHRKLNKTKKIKLSQMGDKFMTDNNLKCKPKKTGFSEKHTFNKEQHTFISPLLKKKNLLQKTTKNKSLVLKKTMLEKNATHNDQGMLKNVRLIF